VYYFFVDLLKVNNGCNKVKVKPKNELAKGFVLIFRNIDCKSSPSLHLALILLLCNRCDYQHLLQIANPNPVPAYLDQSQTLK
jgi:hypothetical protein